MEFELKRLEPVLIDICGKEYPARMPNKAIKELCEIWQIKYFDLFEKLAGGMFDLDEIFDVLYVILKSGGVNVERDMFGDDMEHDTELIGEIMTKISELFNRTQQVESAIEEESADAAKKKRRK